MAKSFFFTILFIAFLISSSQAGYASAASLSELVAAAEKEGRLSFYAPSTVTPAGANELERAFNAKFNTNIDVTYLPSEQLVSGNRVRSLLLLCHQHPQRCG